MRGVSFAVMLTQHPLTNRHRHKIESMKAGSLVEFLGAPIRNEQVRNIIEWLPEKGNLYVIRDICINSSNTDDVVLLEEGCSGIHPLSKKEIGFSTKYYREIQPPTDLTEILEYQHPKHLLIN